MTDLPIKKIYIDTQFKSTNSVSNSNFKIDLPFTVSFPENSVFYIDDVSIPHSWYVIEAGVNDKLYIFVANLTVEAERAYSIVVIPPGNYVGATLATAIEDEITRALTSTAVSAPNLISASYDASLNTITLEADIDGWAFQILTPNDIISNLNGTWGGTPINIGDPQDINEVIGNITGTSDLYARDEPFRSNGGINLQTIRNLYIHSSLGNYGTIGPRGETTIIKKVSVSANKGEVIFDNVLVAYDFGDCSKQSLRTIIFEIKDARGNFINFHGSNLSFSIVFSRA